MQIVQIIVLLIVWLAIEIVIFKYLKGSYYRKNKFFIHILNTFFWFWLLSYFNLSDTNLNKIPIFIGGGIYFVLSFLLIDFIDGLLSGKYIIKRFKKKIPGVLRNIIKFILFFVFTLLILHFHFNIEVTGISVTSAVLAGILGFALQETLGNFLSGIALNMDSPFKHKDWIKVGEDEGWVVDTTWRSTTIHTRGDELIIIPNSMISSQKIINYSRPYRWNALEIDVGVDYSSSPALVKEVMIKCANDSRFVRRDPCPVCWLIDYEDFSIKYKVKFWVKEYEDALIASDDVRTRIWYGFKRSRINIPFPIRVIKNYEEPVDLKKQRIKEIFNMLSTIDLFEPLNNDELEILSKSVQKVIFGKGDILISQNDDGDSMFIILNGKISIELKKEDGGYKRITELTNGGFVGEMSLLTGEKRSATVRTLTEVEAIKVSKNSFKRILVANPKIAEVMSEILAKRKEELENKKLNEKKDVIIMRFENDKNSILSKMQHFFGLNRK